MRMNGRAEGSFAETLMAMMVVTIALTAFMAVFAYSLNANERETPVSTSFVNSLRIEDGQIVGIDESYITEECTRKGYSSMVITLETAGPFGHAYLRLGESSDSDFGYARDTVTVPCDDGTRAALTYEVVAFA